MFRRAGVYVSVFDASCYSLDVANAFLDHGRNQQVRLRAARTRSASKEGSLVPRKNGRIAGVQMPIGADWLKLAEFSCLAIRDILDGPATLVCFGHLARQLKHSTSALVLLG